METVREAPRIDDRSAEMRVEYERARREVVNAGARTRLLLMSGEPDFAAVADAAEVVSLATARLAGFARLLMRG